MIRYMLPELPKRKSLAEAFAALNDEHEQMRRRSGPLYELSKKNSGIVSAEYRAAGSPRRPDGPGLVVSPETGKLVRVDTPEWRAWRAWKRQREQVRREHGMRSAVGNH